MLSYAGRRARAALPIFLVLALPCALDANEIFDARGFNPNRSSSTQLPFEHIDPLTGNLLLVFTDLRLPGNAGFDLVIQRTYNSKIFRDDETFSTIDWDSWAGVGWSLHLGRVRTTWDDTPLAVEMPDGSSHKLFRYFVGDSGLFVTRDYWLYDTNASPPTLRLPNGTVYTFGSVVGFPSRNYYRYATRIQDPFDNKVDIAYGGPTPIPDAIQKITQYLGPPGNPGSQKREITFTTETVNTPTGSRSRLKTMSFLGRTWTYTYVASSEGDKSLPTVLQPPVGRPWRFSYTTSGAITEELEQLTTPNGGTITWTYGTQGAAASGPLAPPFYLGSTDAVRSRVVTKRVSGGRDIASGTRTYWYAQGAHKNQTVITEPTTCAGSAASSTTEYTFLGVGDDYDHGSVWNIGLLAQRLVKEGATVLEAETLVWRTPTANDSLSPEDEFVGPNHDTDIYSPVIGSRTITRGGHTYAITNTYHSQAYSANGPNFNDYGRPWQVVETGDGGTRTTTRTFKYGFTSFIKDRIDTETVTAGSESFKRSWVYNLANGFLKDTYDWGATTTGGVHIAYGPTAVGNIDSITDANSDTTTYSYDWGVRKNVRTPAYPGVDTIRRVINADGTVQSETRRLNENSGAGYTTKYTYDALMRTKSVTPPVGAATTYDYDDANTLGSSFVKRTRGASFVQTFLDGFGRDSGSTNAVGAQTDVGYDACERRSYESLPFDSRHAKDTTGFLYQYDALGRTTNRTNPGSPASSISYRYTGSGLNGLDVEITDEEARKTVQRWTAFGDPGETRLASVTLDSGGALAQTTNYEYNALGSLTSVSGAGSRGRSFTYTTRNQLETESHPEQGTTTYTYYTTGRLQTAINALGTVAKYGYDQNQRLVCVDQSPNASPPCSTLTADDVRIGYDRADNRTNLQNTWVASTFEYDAGNRLGKRTDTVTGPSGAVPFVTSYSYDSRDNLEVLTYPAPSTTVVRYQYDAANRITDVRRNGSATAWASAFSYHPSGAPESYTTADGVLTGATYTGRHWPDVLKIGIPADPYRVLGLDYGYDKVGAPRAS
jgi:YD repeat-containing protein